MWRGGSGSEKGCRAAIESWKSHSTRRSRRGGRVLGYPCRKRGVSVVTTQLSPAAKTTPFQGLEQQQTNVLTREDSTVKKPQKVALAMLPTAAYQTRRDKKSCGLLTHHSAKTVCGVNRKVQEFRRPVSGTAVARPKPLNPCRDFAREFRRPLTRA